MLNGEGGHQTMGPKEIAALHRKQFIARYGEERDSKVRFAEAYQVSEYGRKLTPVLEKQLFPY